MKKVLSVVLAILLLVGCGKENTANNTSGEPYIDRTELTETPPESMTENREPEPVEKLPPAKEQSDIAGSPPEKPEEQSVEKPIEEPEKKPTETPPEVPEEQPEEKPPEGPEEIVSVEDKKEEPAEPPAEKEEEETLPVVVEKETEVIVSSPAAVPDILVAEASGIWEKRTERAVIDYSNIDSGYVMVSFTGQTDKRLKAQVKGPQTTYTYNLTAGQWEVFPLSDGNGKYQTVIYENVTGSKYAAVVSVSFDVMLQSEFAPFLRPNQYVDYSAAKNTLLKAAELVGGESDPLKKVEIVYNFVVNTLTYDREKAASVKSGYLPQLDSVLAKKTGICFDYAALMTAMLRSQNVPCKLVVGYAGNVYHAWISVWTEETGWVDGAIFFDGTAWHRMDPTFASSAQKSDSIMQYIGNGSNYTEKYLY